MAGTLLAARNHVLYRMYDVSRRLLYVGITANFDSRMDSHRGLKPWWQDVATIEVQHFTSRTAVERAERNAIQTERPAFNVTHAPRELRPPRPAPPPAPPKVTATFPLEQPLWDALKPAAFAAGYSRSALIRQFIRWYLRRPGAELPERPGTRYLRRI